jgi:hypothetical protein
MPSESRNFRLIKDKKHFAVHFCLLPSAFTNQQIVAPALSTPASMPHAA